MDERDWLMLKTLYEKKSITKAAAALFISQPALSNRLQHIEARFGTIIVVRGKNGVQFTPEGEYLVKAAYEMLKRVQVYEEDLQNMQEQATGTLRIGASMFFTKYLLPELLRRFRIQYPRVEFKVTTAWSSDIVNLVYNNDVHIGFVRGEYSFSGEKKLLFKEKMFISSKEQLNYTDLPHIPRIDYRNDYTIQVLIDKWWNENYSVPPRIGMEVDRVDTCKEMVAKGLGYGFLPEIILNNNKDICTREMVYRSGKPLTRETWMFYNKDSMQLKLTKAFFDFVQDVDFSTLY
ncbi:MAG: LysR family transcriptional regulator [Firmicutes bacterium]|nr:LysR family transcriptional regulator [Bacillota bacterium]